MSILFPFASGWTSAIYFVVFEVGITVLLFSISASSHRFFISRVISSGSSVTVYESPLPVIGRELQIGRLRSKLFHYATRAIALWAIFVINLYTVGRTGSILSSTTRNYIAVQNAENSDWFKDGAYVFRRDFPALTGCRLGTEDGVEFYNIALDTVSGEKGIEDFNPSGNGMGSVPLDFSKALCLDGVQVRPKEVAMRVVGCGDQGRDCYHNPDADPITIKARVNTLSSHYSSTWLHSPRQLIGFETQDGLMGECVIKTGNRSFCAMWTDSIDGNTSSLWISFLMYSVGDFSYSGNETIVELALKRTSTVVKIVGGRFGSISVGRAISLSISVNTPPVFEMINHLYSQSVEFFPRTKTYEIMKGERNVTEVQKPAIISAIVLIGILMMEILLWCWRIIRYRKFKWMAKRLKLVGLLRTWQEDVQPTGNCLDSLIIPEIGITDTSPTTQRFGLIQGKASPLDPEKITRSL